jgi:hypothetical protein
MVIILVGYGFKTWSSIIGLLDAKRNNINANTEAIKKGTLNERIVDTTNLLLIIDGMIRVEMLQLYSTHISLNQPYEILRKLDKDIKEISARIHESLKPELFNNPSNIVVNSEYLEKYIVNSVTTELISTVKRINREIAERNTPEE